jgi:hypothetical protein
MDAAAPCDREDWGPHVVTRGVGWDWRSLKVLREFAQEIPRVDRDKANETEEVHQE